MSLRSSLFLLLAFVAGCGCTTCANVMLEMNFCPSGVCAEGATQPGISCDDLWHWPYGVFVGRDDCSWRAEC